MKTKTKNKKIAQYCQINSIPPKNYIVSAKNSAFSIVIHHSIYF